MRKLTWIYFKKDTLERSGSVQTEGTPAERPGHVVGGLEWFPSEHCKQVSGGISSPFHPEPSIEEQREAHKRRERSIGRNIGANGPWIGG